jgi:hypothetical protein
MVAKPELSVSAGEPQSDAHGQFWTPAKVTLRWPQADQLPGPSVEVSVVASIRGQMTVDELRIAHIQAAHDVLTAALLSLEELPSAKPTAQKLKQQETRSRTKRV